MAATRVLVAHRSPTERAAIRAALGESGWEIVEAEDDEAAWAALPADVVLHDGDLGLLDRMREDAALRTIPVIVVGRAEKSDILAALQRGAHDYLTSPFEPAELAARVRAAVRTAELLARLARRNAELERFASTAAHDLKSPLTVIKGGVDLLQTAWDDLSPDVRFQQLGAINRAASRASAMVDDLLTLARFDVRHNGDPAEVDARACVDAVVAGMGLPGIEVSGEWGTVGMPEVDLSAAVRNLLDNADHYGRGPDGTLAVEVRGRRDGPWQVIEVRDHGPGVPVEDRPRVFDAFYRGPGSRDVNPASTGVGLAIVARALDRWGGRASVGEASPGAVFTLTVPVAQ